MLLAALQICVERWPGPRIGPALGVRAAMLASLSHSLAVGVGVLHFRTVLWGRVGWRSSFLVVGFAAPVPLLTSGFLPSAFLCLRVSHSPLPT